MCYGGGVRTVSNWVFDPDSLDREEFFFIYLFFVHFSSLLQDQPQNSRSLKLIKLYFYAIHRVHPGPGFEAKSH